MRANFTGSFTTENDIIPDIFHLTKIVFETRSQLVPWKEISFSGCEITTSKTLGKFESQWKDFDIDVDGEPCDSFMGSMAAIMIGDCIVTGITVTSDAEIKTLHLDEMQFTDKACTVSLDMSLFESVPAITTEFFE